jgi:hypothetical protein
MNIAKENPVDRIDRIKAFSRKLILACWAVIFFIVAGAIVAGMLLSDDTSTIEVQTVFWITLMLLIIRFLKCCDRDGIFSVSSIKSIRWIGWFIVISELLLLIMVGGYLLAAYIVDFDSEISRLLPTITVSTTPHRITQMIFGVFLLILARILQVGLELKDDAEFTI